MSDFVLGRTYALLYLSNMSVDSSRSNFSMPIWRRRRYAPSDRRVKRYWRLCTGSQSKVSAEVSIFDILAHDTDHVFGNGTKALAARFLRAQDSSWKIEALL